MGEIHGAAGKGDPYHLLELLEAGADPDDPTGMHGATPLIAAASRGNLIAIRVLLKFGARLDLEDEKGRTALIAASSIELKTFLLKAGANPDAGRFHGTTLTASMVPFRKRELIDLFLSYGADPTAEVEKGKTIQDCLDDPNYGWDTFDEFKERRSLTSPAAILRLSENLRLSPEQFVSQHRTIMLWGYRAEELEDPALSAWVAGVTEILMSIDRQEAAYSEHLEGEELESALLSVAHERRRLAREADKKQRRKAFEGTYLKDDSL